MNWCFVGLDLGQAKDFTAVAVLECAEVLGAWDAVVCAQRKHVEFRLRHLERMALGTPYPAVAERVVKITRSEAIAGRCSLVVDATGVGRPGCLLMPVNITGGASETRNGGYYGVPKRDLVTGMQVLLQSGGLQIAAGIPYGAALVEEMAEMRATVTAAGNTQFGAWREGAHDDLVLAVALACWAARKRYPHGPYGAAEYWKRTEQGEWERGIRDWARGRRQGYFQATMLVGWPRISGWCDSWPAEVRDQRRTTECRRQPWITHLAEYESFNASAIEVTKASTLGSLPPIVLSHDTSRPEAAETAWMTMQQNLAKLSTRRTLSVVTGATHNIQEDHPSAIIDAARAEVEAVRRERHNRGAGTDLSKPGIPQQ